jgi:hypothetical protein
VSRELSQCEDAPSEEEFFSTEEFVNSDISYAEAEGNFIKKLGKILLKN